MTRALVTGGAGFIGSSIADALLQAGAEVVILDDFSTGFREHIPPAAKVVEGSIADEALVVASVKGCDLVFHEAATRGVLRSVEAPVETDTINTHGTLMLLKAAADAGVGRFVYASSSSVYGGADVLPTPETAPVRPRSPYAVTKLAGEHYCRVFAELYGLETVALRYFNVFGPRQRPDSAYAAVIPLFIEALRTTGRPVVHGDGHQSRDFTFIDDAVRANLLAAEAPAERCSGRVYNVAPGRTHDLLAVLEILGRVMGVAYEIESSPPRAGDIRHSMADATAAETDLGWRPAVSMTDGLRRTVEWFMRRSESSPSVAPAAGPG